MSHFLAAASISEGADFGTLSPWSRLDLWPVRLGQAYLYFRPWLEDRAVVVFEPTHGAGESLVATLAASDRPEPGYLGINLRRMDLSAIPPGFAGLILGETPVEEARGAFPGRTVRALRHADAFPFSLSPCEDAEADLVVVGELPMPAWPSIGLAMPTCRNAAGAVRAAIACLAAYPGALRVAFVANGMPEAQLEALRAATAGAPHRLSLIVERRNLGLAGAANVGLSALGSDAWCDLFGVIHDDVYPHFDCLAQCAATALELEKLERRVGAVGPCTNLAQGVQQVDVGPYDTIEGMQRRGDVHNLGNHSKATEVWRLGSHLELISAEALEAIGGFDPLFGSGTLLEDDYSLRLRRAGFSQWRADGAYAHHDGGFTFKRLRIDESLNLERAHKLFLRKWRCESLREAFERGERGEARLPLRAAIESSGHVALVNGEFVDLVHQASEIEVAAFLAHRADLSGPDLRTRLLRALDEAA